MTSPRADVLLFVLSVFSFSIFSLAASSLSDFSSFSLSVFSLSVFASSNEGDGVDVLVTLIDAGLGTMTVLPFDELFDAFDVFDALFDAFDAFMDPNGLGLEMLNVWFEMFVDTGL